MLSDTDADIENNYSSSIRLVDVERKGSASWGFHLTRGKWDPYPWVSSVDVGTAAHAAGLKPGDCLVEVNGEDVIGQKISEVAEIVKSKPDQVSLLLWNAGVDPQCTPEAVCCGPMPTNLQRLSACMSTILAFLECPVCLDTIPPPTYQCDNGHLICIRCRTKSERCPVCRLRFTRGRSLLSDQVYNALIDSFNLREEPDEGRGVKMQQIFKLKNKNRNIPDIKVTQSHTNKFLARLAGKSSSVDNLANPKFITPPNGANEEFNSNNLKTKSLSTNEIFQSESPTVSRSGSINRLSRNDKNKYLSLQTSRPASYHGSFESLNRRIDDHSISSVAKENEDDNLYHCPYLSSCTFLIKGKNMIEHFQLSHKGPLIQFFTPNIQIKLKKVLKSKDLCYLIQYDANIFFLKVELIKVINEIEMCNKSENILIWTWLLGDKKTCKDYDMQVRVIKGGSNEAILCVRNCVCSLSGTSYQDMKDYKKGVFLNAKTLDTFNTPDSDIVLDISIVKSDYE